jgi:hypothetical protein
MKKIVSNSMVAHLWANRSQPEARNPGGTFFFEGDTIYSYRKNWPIARFTNKFTHDSLGQNGRTIVLFNSDSYSITTSAHSRLARRALYQRSVHEISVPFVLPEFDAHASNLKYLAYRAELFAVRAGRSRQQAEYNLHTATGYVEEFGTYKAAFLPEYPGTVSIPEDLAGIVAKKIEKVKEQQEQAHARMLEREKAAIAEALKHLDEWRAEGRLSLPNAYLLPVFLRKINRNKHILGHGVTEKTEPIVQTSLNAEIPLDHARRVWNAVRRAVITGAEYQRNGHTIHAGAFTVDRIDADGTLHAGCHTIKLDEMRRFAEGEGWAV